MTILKTVQIVSTSGVLGGKPRIEGRRIGVDLVAYHVVHRGWDLDRMGRSFNLSPSEVYAALSYYYDHKDEIERQIEENLEDDEDVPRIQDVANLLDKLLSVREAAGRLGISERGVRKLIEAGTLPAEKIGASWFIHPADLERDAIKQRKPGRPAKRDS